MTMIGRSEPACSCGAPEASGITHRYNGKPCYYNSDGFEIDGKTPHEAEDYVNVDDEDANDEENIGHLQEKQPDPSSPAEVFGIGELKTITFDSGYASREAFEIASGITEEGDRVHISCDANISPMARRILGIMEDTLTLFVKKNRGYGEETSDSLGSKGQYVDISRKTGKLKHTLWQGNPGYGESEEEICMDLIGHLGMTIDFLRRGM